MRHAGASLGRRAASRPIQRQRFAGRGTRCGNRCGKRRRSPESPGQSSPERYAATARLAPGGASRSIRDAVRLAPGGAPARSGDEVRLVRGGAPRSFPMAGRFVSVARGLLVRFHGGNTVNISSVEAKDRSAMGRTRSGYGVSAGRRVWAARCGWAGHCVSAGRCISAGRCDSRGHTSAPRGCGPRACRGTGNDAARCRAIGIDRENRGGASLAFSD